MAVISIGMAKGVTPYQGSDDQFRPRLINFRLWNVTEAARAAAAEQFELESFALNLLANYMNLKRESIDLQPGGQWQPSDFVVSGVSFIP